MRRLLPVLLLLLPATAQAQTIFSSDFTAANTVGNFDSNVSHALVTPTREVGNCPSGGASIRFVLATTGVNSQPNWGLRKAVTDTVIQGDTRYYRLRLRYNGSTNFGGNNGPWYTKSVIWGNDNTGNGGRAIVWTGVGSIDNTTPTYWVSKNVGTKAASDLSTVNGWNNVQVRMRSSSVGGVADGRVDLYIGTANTSESTPTSSVTGLDLDLTSTNGWTNETIGFGGEVDQTTLATGTGFVDMNVCDIQYSTTFDTSWNSPGGATSNYYRFRFKVEALTLPVATFAAVWLLGIRRRA